MDHSKIILNKEALQRTLKRMSHEILERNKGTDDLVIIGIKKKGAYIAKQIHDDILQIETVNLPLGELDITPYRDDIQKKAKDSSTVDFSVENKKVILVDDVLYTGRTVRAALDAILNYGRPKEIQLAILIDRGHRELPIRSDYVGKNIPTSKEERVLVTVNDDNTLEGVYLEKTNN